LRSYGRWKGEPILSDDEERGCVQPPLVDEHRRATIEEGLHGSALQRKVVVSGESDGGGEVELPAEPRLDLVDASGDVRERGSFEHAQVVVDGLALQLTQLGAPLDEECRRAADDQGNRGGRGHRGGPDRPTDAPRCRSRAR
jgi:hypothetical protein